MSRSDRLGDKLGPRLVQLLTDATVRSRASLAPHEARVHQAASQALIDRAGHEVANLWRPLIKEAIAEAGEDMHPLMTDHLTRIGSGAHQWEAIAGHLQMGSVGAIGSVLSNVMFPVTGLINLHDRNLPVDAQTGAAAVAAGLAPYSLGDENAGVWGYRPEAFRFMWELAQTIPPADVLWQLVNRGLMSEKEAQRWLQRGAVPEQLHGHIMALRRLELTPADAALAVLRGELDHGSGREIAGRAGMHAADFDTLLSNTGEPIGLQQLAEALRRGFINRERFARGLRQSRVRNEWLDVAEALRYEPVPTADAVDAALRGHTTWDKAQSIAEQNGIEPGEFDILRANAGSPPAPEQLLELWRRGFIDEQQVDSGLRFGRLRDQFIPWVKHLRYERLSTADAADAWLRGHLTRDQAVSIMTENGLAPGDTGTALANAGNPLGLMQLLEALRRGFIDEAKFTQGFRESRYRPEWQATALRLRHSPMSTADAVEAAVQGHLTLDAAHAIATENGLDPSQFATLYQTAGSPLSRTEAEALYNRGLMSIGQVAEALRESRLKDKYVHLAEQLRVRLPEPRLIINALEEGVIARSAAEKLLGDQGYTHQTVTMMIATAEARSTGPHRQLMSGEIARLYALGIIGDTEATRLLEQLHYTAQSASLILRVAVYQRQQHVLESGIGAIKSHYLAGRISEAVALGDLHALNLPHGAADSYLKVWRLDKLAHPRQLTAAQIVKAAKLGLFAAPDQRDTPEGQRANQATAHDRLVALGYDSADATLLLEGA
jgi:hypothetical protein